VRTAKVSSSVHTRRLTEGADVRLISVSATVMASYADEIVPASDTVTIELLLDEPAEGEGEGEGEGDGEDEGGGDAP
jgi:hypothetical protein